MPFRGRSGALTVQQLQRHGAVDVLPPVLAVGRHGDLPVGPLAGQVDTDAGNHGGPILQAECGEVQTVGKDDNSGTTLLKDRTFIQSTTGFHRAEHFSLAYTVKDLCLGQTGCGTPINDEHYIRQP